MQPYFRSSDYNYESAKKASGNVAGLCSWCKAMCTYHEVAKVVEPKIATLKASEAELKVRFFSYSFFLIYCNFRPRFPKRECLDEKWSVDICTCYEVAKVALRKGAKLRAFEAERTFAILSSRRAFSGFVLERKRAVPGTPMRSRRLQQTM